MSRKVIKNQVLFLTIFVCLPSFCRISDYKYFRLIPGTYICQFYWIVQIPMPFALKLLCFLSVLNRENELRDTSLLTNFMFVSPYLRVCLCVCMYIFIST